MKLKKNHQTEALYDKYFDFDLEEFENDEVEYIEEGLYEGIIVDVQNCSKTYLLKIQLEDGLFLAHISKTIRYQPRRFLYDVLKRCKNTSSKNLIGLQVDFEVEDYEKDNGVVASSLIYIEITGEE